MNRAKVILKVILLPIDRADLKRYMEKTYYMTVAYPDGGKSGPTRLLAVHDLKQAKRVIKQQQKIYPDCHFQLDEYEDNWSLNCRCTLSLSYPSLNSQ